MKITMIIYLVGYHCNQEIIILTIKPKLILKQKISHNKLRNLKETTIFSLVK